MRMDLERKSNTQILLNNLQGAQAQGLKAAAYPFYNEIKRSLRHGYHSSLGNWGDFVTGNNVNHVTTSQPRFVAGGAEIRVGTDLMYALYWELGHHNIFTRHFERDEKWAPAYAATRAQAFEAYARVFGRVWKGGHT